MQSNPPIEWWRPDAAAAPAAAAAVDPGLATPARGRVAFGALVAFTVILIASPQEYVPALKPLRIGLLAGVAALLAYWAQLMNGGGPRVAPAREMKLAVLLILWSVVTIPASLWRGGSASMLVDMFLKAVIVFWLISVTVNTTQRLRTLVWVLSVLMIPLSLSALQQYAGGHFTRAGRIDGYGDGIAGNPNDLALMLAIVLPLTIALALQSGRVVARVVAALLVLVAAAAIIVTFSRSGSLVLITITIAYTASLVRRGAVVLGIAAMLLVLAALPLLPAGFYERMSTISDVESDPTGSAQQRWQDMRMAAGYVSHLPIVGAGLGMSDLALNELRGFQWQPVHNVYLQYGVDLGIPGLALFLLLFVGVIVAAGRAARTFMTTGQAPAAEIARAIRFSLIGFAVGAMFYPVAYHFYFYYLAGLAVAVQRISQRGV